MDYVYVPTIKVSLLLNKEGQGVVSLWEENIIGDNDVKRAITKGMGLSLEKIKIDENDIKLLEQNGTPALSSPLYFSELPDYIKGNFDDNTQKIFNMTDKKNKNPYFVIMVDSGTSLQRV